MDQSIQTNSPFIVFENRYEIFLKVRIISKVVIVLQGYILTSFLTENLRNRIVKNFQNNRNFWKNVKKKQISSNESKI